jgi:hypothetical protein
MDNKRAIKILDALDEDAFVLIFTKEDAEVLLGSEDNPMTEKEWWVSRRSMEWYFQSDYVGGAWDAWRVLISEDYRERIKNEA